jgi:hypothetical protein
MSRIAQGSSWYDERKADASTIAIIHQDKLMNDAPTLSKHVLAVAGLGLGQRALFCNVSMSRRSMRSS